jgi:hypothetical protein
VRCVEFPGVDVSSEVHTVAGAWDMLLTILRLCAVLWTPDMANFNTKMQNMSASQRPPSQLNANGPSSFQSSLSGDRGDFDSREEDVDDCMQNDMMRMLLGESDERADPSGTRRTAPGKMHDNVANMMMANAQSDFLLVQSWIQEAMPGQEGVLVAGRFRNEVQGFGCRVLFLAFSSAGRFRAALCVCVCVCAFVCG